MATDYYDPNFSARAIGARTNAAGTPVTDLTAEEDRLSHAFITQGWVKEPDSFLVSAVSDWDINIGVGSRRDLYLVDGDAAGQGKYVVRLYGATKATIDAAEGALDRIDEIYLVVEDDAYDGNSRSLARLAYQKGTPGVSPSAPGPDGGWNAYALLATIDLPAGSPNIESVTITDERDAAQVIVDAGTLDGLEAGDFAMSSHNHDATYADIAHEGSTTDHPDATTSDAGFMSGSDKAKLDGIEAGAEVNPSASEILTAIKTVDGAGSGLDADLLDGQHGSYYATSGHNHDSRYYQESEVDTALSGYRDKPAACHVRRTTDESVNNATIETIPMTHTWDEQGGLEKVADEGVNGVGITGLTSGRFYLITGSIAWATNTTGTRTALIYSSIEGDIAAHRKVAQAGDKTMTQVQVIHYCTNSSEHIRLRGYQDSGGALNVKAGTGETWLSVVELSF